MKKAILVVLILVLAGSAGASRVSVGVWGGLRTGEFAPSLGRFSSSSLRTVTANELGGQVAWEAWKPLSIRARLSRISGCISYEENPRSPYGEPVERFELKGYPFALEVLPAFQVGEKVLIRAGGGVSFYDLTGVQTFFVGGWDNIYTTPEFSIKGRGAQFLVSVEGMFWKNIGLEANYEKGAARFKCSFSPYITVGDFDRINEDYATTIEAYRLGLAYHF